MGRKRYIGGWIIALLLLCSGIGALAPLPAWAQAPATSGTTADAGAGENTDVCTTFQQRAEAQETAESQGGASTGTAEKPGLLSEIYLFIKDIVDDSTQRLYETFIFNSGYQQAVGAAMTLMVIIYAVGFMIGVVQPSFGQALLRLIRFGIVAALIAPSGWAFFSDPVDGAGVVAFFNDGTDELVRGVIAIGTGVEAPPGATPFYQLDKVAEFLIQPDTIIAILGSVFTGGPFGLAMGGLLMFAVAGFVQLLIRALKVYAVSYVARSLLLGVGPVFIVFLLFDKTRNLFITWINALVSLALQPILLFTFLSFFMVLIDSATKDLFGAELCWTEYKFTEGSQNNPVMWRWTHPGTNTPIKSDMTWEGAFECLISGSASCPEFPLNIIDVLTFLLLVYLATRFAGVIDRISNELSNAYIVLDAGGRFDQFMQRQGRQSDSGGFLGGILGKNERVAGSRDGG